MFYFAFFLFTAAVAESDDWVPWEMVEVRFATEHNIGSTGSGNNEYSHISEDYITLFDEFAAKEGMHLDKRNFRLFGTDSAIGLTTFGMRTVDCEQFRKFLSGITAQKYHIEYASVRCAELSFTLCLTFSCDIYNNYNATVTSITTTPSTTTTTYKATKNDIQSLYGSYGPLF